MRKGNAHLYKQQLQGNLSMETACSHIYDQVFYPPAQRQPTKKTVLVPLVLLPNRLSQKTKKSKAGTSFVSPPGCLSVFQKKSKIG